MSNGNPVDENPHSLEEAYQKHSHVAEKAKNDYFQAFQHLILQLNTNQLKSFEMILLEKESYELCGQELIESLQQKLLIQLQSTMNQFWVECDVDNCLTTLEMLKEKYKDYEGKDWKVLEKKPEELLMPTRVRFKKARLRYLEKQLDFQNKHFEQILSTNKKYREEIEDLRNVREYCKQAIKNNTNALEEMKPRIQKMQEELADVCENV